MRQVRTFLLRPEFCHFHANGGGYRSDEERAAEFEECFLRFHSRIFGFEKVVKS